MVGADKGKGGSQLIALELGGEEGEHQERGLGYSERQKGKQSRRIAGNDEERKGCERYWRKKKEKESRRWLRTLNQLPDHGVYHWWRLTIISILQGPWT